MMFDKMIKNIKINLNIKIKLNELNKIGYNFPVGWVSVCDLTNLKITYPNHRHEWRGDGGGITKKEVTI